MRHHSRGRPLRRILFHLPLTHSRSDTPGPSCSEPEVEGTGYLSPKVGEKGDCGAGGKK